MFTALMLMPAMSYGQQITRQSDGKVSIRAEQVPLGPLLQALGQISPFEKIELKDGVDARLVTVTVENETVFRAVVRLLESAGVNYMLGGGSLFAGDRAGVMSGGASEDRRVADPLNKEADILREDVLQSQAVDSQPSDNGRAEDEARIRIAELARALAPPAVPIPPGAPVDLPFPAPDGGTRMREVMPLERYSQPLPFPANEATSRARAAPGVSDPRLQPLIDAQSPSRAPGR